MERFKFNLTMSIILLGWFYISIKAGWEVASLLIGLALVMVWVTIDTFNFPPRVDNRDKTDLSMRFANKEDLDKIKKLMGIIQEDDQILMPHGDRIHVLKVFNTGQDNMAIEVVHPPYGVLEYEIWQLEIREGEVIKPTDQRYDNKMATEMGY